MKLTLANIKQVKRNTESLLTRRVCNYVIDRWGDYSDKSGIFTDVLHYGCQSGVVGELIYYSDTVRFYKQYRQEINELLYRLMKEMGSYAPSDLFGDKWDKEDPLAQDVNKKLYRHENGRKHLQSRLLPLRWVSCLQRRNAARILQHERARCGTYLPRQYILFARKDRARKRLHAQL